MMWIWCSNYKWRGGSNDDNLSFNSEPTSDWQSLSITALKQAPAAAATPAALQIVA